jgi:nicotinate-nucleotide adenylyltransferase
LAIMPLRIGVFGGTFDPPHIGHLVTAVNVRAALSLDRVLLVVANIPWQKAGRRPISPSADRLALVTEAVRGFDGVEASPIEIEHGGDSVTADTLETLRARDPNVELFVILGADAAAGLPTWRRPEVVRSLATIVAVSRPGTPTCAPLPGWRWVDVEVPRLDVSSSSLRERAAKGQPLDVLVPPAVIDRIRELRLYGLAA